MEVLTGAIVNFAAIIAGCVLGLLFKGGIPKRVHETVTSGLGLCVLLVGIAGSLKVNNLLLVIISVAVGSITGELIDIEKRLQSLGEWVESKFKGKGGRISEGFVTASLMFCVGAMAIVGSLESGLTNNHQTLFAKSMLDGLISIVFTASLGVGVAFSAVPVLLYQGIISLCASFLKEVLTGPVIADMTSAGSLLIIGLALNMLKVSKIKVANLLPAVFVPIIYQLLSQLF